jgi:hypothetical protein
MGLLTARFGLVLLALLCLALGLGGCRGGAVGPTPPASSSDPQAARDAIRARFANLPPARVAAFLQRLGSPARHAGFTRPNPPRKRAAVSLPYFMWATDAYEAGVTPAGWYHAVQAQPGPEGGMATTPAGPDAPLNFAYVLYRIDDVTEPIGSLAISGEGGPFGVAVYDFAGGGRGWELLYYGPAPGRTVGLDAPGASYTNAGNDMALVCFSLHPDAATFWSFTLSSDAPPPPVPPVAVLGADPEAGTAPLDVRLLAGFSQDDGSIVGYRFDPEGDGTFVDNGADSTFEFTYTEPGVYDAMVEVTDDDGLTDTAAFSVVVAGGSYSEVEDNDAPAQANALPAAPFELWYGNVGTGGPNDGDSVDYFELTDAALGDTLTFELAFSRPFSAVSLALLDAEGHVLAQDQGHDQPLRITRKLVANDLAPYYIRVTEVPEEETDYFLAAYPDKIWNEYENNDDAAEANFGTFDNGGFNAWLGSLGAADGYQSMDGDAHDWLASYDTVRPGDTLDLGVTYAEATGNIDITLLDSEGDILAASADTDGSEQIVYTYQEGDAGPLYVRLELVSGYSDYLVNAKVDFLGSEDYDEVENNDTALQASALPGASFAGYTGNLGSAGPYNTDTVDWFSFPAAVGEHRTFTITFDDTQAARLYAAIYRTREEGLGPIPEKLKERSSATSPLVITYTRRSVDSGPLLLELSAREDGDPADIPYTIDCTDGPLSFDEVEDNDTKVQANPLVFADDGLGNLQFTGFTASLGPGSESYDGDGLDWYSVDWQPNHTVRLRGYFEPVDGALLLELIDSLDNVVATSTVVDGHYTELTAFNDGTQLAPFHLRCTAVGSTEYWLDGFTFEDGS